MELGLSSRGDIPAGDRSSRFLSLTPHYDFPAGIPAGERIRLNTFTLTLYNIIGFQLPQYGQRRSAVTETASNPGGYLSALGLRGKATPTAWKTPTRFRRYDAWNLRICTIVFLGHHTGFSNIVHTGMMNDFHTKQK